MRESFALCLLRPPVSIFREETEKNLFLFERKLLCGIDVRIIFQNFKVQVRPVFIFFSVRLGHPSR